MEKVMCLKCKDIGFTASPKYTLCHCGGNLTIIGDEQFRMEVTRLLGSIKERGVCTHTAVLSGHAIAYNHSQHEEAKTEIEEYETVANLS